MLYPYFSFEGRQKRLPYFSRLIFLQSLLALSAVWASYTFDEPTSFIYAIMGIVIVQQASVICLTVQRLHDMGHSGWFCWGLWLPGLVFLGKNPLFFKQLRDGTLNPDATDFILMACVALFVGGLIFSPGQKGDNKYEYYIKV